MTLAIDAAASIDAAESLLHRHPANPILTSKDWPYRINSAFNAGATLLADGSTLLLCRVEDRRGLSHLCAARSVNGVNGWDIDATPTLMPDPDEYPEELWGIEDPRITYVPELQQYAVAYTSYSKGCLLYTSTQKVAHDVGLPADRILTGSEVDTTDDAALALSLIHI